MVQPRVGSPHGTVLRACIQPRLAHGGPSLASPYTRSTVGPQLGYSGTDRGGLTLPKSLLGSAQLIELSPCSALSKGSPARNETCCQGPRLFLS